MQLGIIGVWTWAFDRFPAARARDAATELDELGYGTIWLPESAGREAFSLAQLLLGATRRVVVANGIARVTERTARAAAAAHHLLAETSGDRHLLGLGGTHPGSPGGTATAMARYLDQLDTATDTSPGGDRAQRLILAAQHPAMLALARHRSLGTHPYITPVEHTVWAREQLGPDLPLAPELTVVLDTDPRRARDTARRHIGGYLGAGPYIRKMRRFGYTDADLADGGSDRLLDALVAHGDDHAIARRVRDHLTAGATHVSIQVLTDTDDQLLDAWRHLAPALAAPATTSSTTSTTVR